jgi:hypothetical protein
MLVIATPRLEIREPLGESDGAAPNRRTHHGRKLHGVVTEIWCLFGRRNRLQGARGS